jgi:F-type H+-transporting ATPase subunit b
VNTLNTKHLHTALLSMFVATAAFAAEHGEAAAAHGEAAAAGGHHGAPHVSNWWGIGEQYANTPALGWLTITFLIFVGILVTFGRPAIKKHLETRADTVEKAIAEARRAREDAEKRAKDAEAKLAALSSEVEKMKAEFTAQGQLESERINVAAADMAKKIARDAEDTIGAETERAKEALRVEAAKLALQLAEERIKQLLTDADDGKLKTSLIQGLSA